MINISVLGACGRIGQLICRQVSATKDLKLTGALARTGSTFLGTEIADLINCKHTKVRITDNLKESLFNADVAIDFSTSDILEHAIESTEQNIPIVIGSTILSKDEIYSLKQLVSKGGKIFLSPNMSIGVNAIFDMIKSLTGSLDTSYDIELSETHHKLKKDAPSGTAKKMLEIITEARNCSSNSVVYGRKGSNSLRKEGEIGIHSIRCGDIVGEHVVVFSGNGETITIKHEVNNRDVFAIGAIKAARFMVDSVPGFYSMKDILNNT